MPLAIDFWMDFGGFRKALMRYFRCRFVGGDGAKLGAESRSKFYKSGGKAEGKRRKAAREIPRGRKTLPTRPRDALRDPKTLPGGPQVGPKTGFWEIFNLKMEPCWHHFRIQRPSYVKSS